VNTESNYSYISRTEETGGGEGRTRVVIKGSVEGSKKKKKVHLSYSKGRFSVGIKRRRNQKENRRKNKRGGEGRPGDGGGFPCKGVGGRGAKGEKGPDNRKVQKKQVATNVN